jgi:Rab proteins geranylgeranyltransferase component A
LKEQLATNEDTSATTSSGSSANDSTIPLSPKGSNQSLKFHSTATQTNFPITQVGSQVQTKYGTGTVVNKTLPTETTPGKLEVGLANWTLAHGKSPTVSFGVTLEQLLENTDTKNNNQSIEQAMEDYFQNKTNEIQSLASLQATQILTQQSRSLAFDVTPSLLYASGVGVKGLLTSNVAEHLEFQTMHGMYWLDADQKLQRVPCSKGDVMQSPLLPPLDKRRFMKFFQTAMDYATERELQREGVVEHDTDDKEEGVLSLNERQLNQGRSLARPQNKAMAKKDLETLYDCMESGMPLDDYLQQHAKLSSLPLRQLIRHALALEIHSNADRENTTLSTLEGMGRLCDHLKALGRYGTTAFLTPLYGSGEMPQFFCRSAAVYGATYLLRRNIVQVNLDDDRVQGVTLGANDDAFYGPPVPEKKMPASHVVVAQDAMINPTPQPGSKLLRRVSILRGTLLPKESRAVIIIPPTAQHRYAIHGLVLDETTKVAPYGCSILHLTTVVETDSDNSDVLETTARVIVRSSKTVDEIFHATFSYDIHPPPKDSVEGLHVIHRPAMPLVVDTAFEQARVIFSKICGPELEFLALSEEMQTKLKEQLKDAYRGPNVAEDDTEQVVLDSAMEMLAT